MRLRLGELAFLPLAAACATAILIAPAAAGSREHDRIYADSFGNLIVHSPSGYKRIIVGAGHLAGELSQYEKTGKNSDVVYLEGNGSHTVYESGCYRPPVLVKGRSYMYGFDQGEIPLQGGPCR